LKFETVREAVEKGGVLTDMRVFMPSGVVESNAVLLVSPLPRSKNKGRAFQREKQDIGQL
jgi:hypothetical protein